MTASIDPALAEVFAANHRRNQTLLNADGSRTRAYELRDIEALPIAVGSRVKFLNSRRWWTVQACSPRFAVLTRLEDFTREPLYTVIAWEEGRRGPHDSWGYACVSREDCEGVLAALEGGDIELSERRAVYLDVAAIA